MTHYPSLGDLLNRTPRELAEAYNEASETLTWLVRCNQTPTRVAEYQETLDLCSRIRFAFHVRVAANGIEPRKAPK